MTAVRSFTTLSTMRVSIFSAMKLDHWLPPFLRAEIARWSVSLSKSSASELVESCVSFSRVTRCGEGVCARVIGLGDIDLDCSLRGSRAVFLTALLRVLLRLDDARHNQCMATLCRALPQCHGNALLPSTSCWDIDNASGSVLHVVAAVIAIASCPSRRSGSGSFAGCTIAFDALLTLRGSRSRFWPSCLDSLVTLARRGRSLHTAF